ncbi:hypothetical protein MG290_01885 [Flavobacterium sp. CBA20B-1]|uniref:helix-turn-helix domain-containing protein n=1 Tax=unclassified Flavobacterium TaxID=196869 RepID=UPI0022256213|nr:MULTISPECIES: helix-turn-helix domain-containing protein [unclassified Flavobacterium]WCM42446.1 hypothetical protein MG290_01885 [Flavobacterium sp. CBA20B-1]
MELNIILEVVTEETNTTPDVLKSPLRKRAIADARFLFFWFAFYLTNKSCKEIGDYLGRKHNTAIHGANRATELKKYHKDFKQKFKNINDKLNLS